MTQLEEKAMLAEFMGWTDTWLEIYFDDYNDLMLVVEKIEDTFINDFECYFRIDGNLCIIRAEYEPMNVFIESYIATTKLEAIYRACVEFVKWWNIQNEKEVK